jgi:hypothetical protein
MQLHGLSRRREDICSSHLQLIVLHEQKIKRMEGVLATMKRTYITRQPRMNWREITRVETQLSAYEHSVARILYHVLEGTIVFCVCYIHLFCNQKALLM